MNIELGVEKKETPIHCWSECRIVYFRKCDIDNFGAKDKVSGRVYTLHA